MAEGIYLQPEEAAKIERDLANPSTAGNIGIEIAKRNQRIKELENQVASLSARQSRVGRDSEASLFYITFTCYQWIPLFQLCNGYDCVYK